MTREEAIERIKDHMFVHKICEERAVKITEALNMAICALEQPAIIQCKDTISRQAAIDAFSCCKLTPDGGIDANYAIDILKQLPPAQLERDTPRKPTETTDRTWGIPHRQAVCPNCDSYLVDVYFIDGSKRKVSYCESCGQAIDWEGWEEGD